MPMADQPRLNGLGHDNGTTSSAAVASSIMCRTCGCLNFSGHDDCEGCRATRASDAASIAPVPVPVARHPFLPTTRVSNGTTRGVRNGITTHASSLTGARLQPQDSASKEVASDAQESASHHTRAAVPAPVNGPASGRASNSNGGSHVHRTTTAMTSSDQAMKRDASDAGATRISHPGSSLPQISPSASSAMESHNGTLPASSTSTSSIGQASASATQSATPASGVVGDKRARESAKPSRSQEIIDLISSDEDSEDHQRRAAKRARQEARMHKSNARLALRKIDPEGEDTLSSAAGPQVDERISLDPTQGRSFDTIEFNPNDFPNMTEATQAMRGRNPAPSVSSVASSAATTPTSATSAPPFSAATTPTSASSASSAPPLPNEVPVSASLPSSEKPSTLATSTRLTPMPAVTTINTEVLTAIPSVEAVATGTTNDTDETGHHPGNEEESITASPAFATAPAERTPDQATSPVRIEAEAPRSDSKNLLETSETATLPPIAPVLGTAAVVNPLSASQDPIVLDDSEDESEEEESDTSGPALYQSRRFESIVFNSRDFLTANEGLNLARRSSTVTRVPSSPVAREAGAASSVQPTVDGSTVNAISDNQIPEQEPQVTITDGGMNILQAKRKPAPLFDSQPSLDAPEALKMEPGTIKIERPASLLTVRIIKPTLGHCTTDFLQFMRDCVDDEDQDDDYEEVSRTKLLEVVDLTNGTDESGDEDDDEDDYFEIMETVPPSQVHSATSSDPLRVASTAAVAVVVPSIREGEGTIMPVGENGKLQTAPTIVKRTRAPRPKETCALCEEKAWIRSLVNCPDCKKFYHKRCAREYGNEDICWSCELEDIIDDTEVTEDHKSEVADIFGALRQSSDSEQGDDVGDDDLEEKAAVPSSVEQAPIPLSSAITRSTRRWKEFLDVSTAPMDEKFNHVTSQITQELQDEQSKSKYSKGFARKEDLENEMAQVVDHYADLQDREERLREERPRMPPPGSVGDDARAGGGISVLKPAESPAATATTTNATAESASVHQ